MASICDKCAYYYDICPVADLRQISTENNRDIVACQCYLLDPAITLERDARQAVQQLIVKGRIKTANIVRTKGSITVETVPSVSDGEVLQEMKHGREMKGWDDD